MRLSLSPLLAALVAAAAVTSTHGVVSRSALSAPQRWTNHKSAFGLVQRLSRGGAKAVSDEAETKEEGEPVELYLPGLLETSISRAKKVRSLAAWCLLNFVVDLAPSSFIHHFLFLSTQKATASADSTITLSPAKAKELSFKEGDVIMVIGRRRRAAYAKVHIHKGKKSVATVSASMAMNLRLRNGDKVKIASLTSESDEEHTSGDMILFQSSPKPVTSVTFSPVEDSLSSLESSEGGDEISDEEIMERFVTPYMELDDKVALVKKGHIVKMTDDNGRNLEFIVTHVELEGSTPEEGAEEGKCMPSFTTC